MMGPVVSKEYPVIAWWSGGVTSAVTCKICIDWWGVENVRIICIDTHNEDDDTYRFKSDCENWYGKEIEMISNKRYSSIEDVWYENLSLNVATGAKCSSELKIVTRQQFIKQNKFSYQAFGFDSSESNRAKGMLENNAHLRPIFPLISLLLTKKACIKVIEKANSLFLNIQVPKTYREGYHNNNCFKTGCVQGGIGYWQKIMKEDYNKFYKMAMVEHELTDLKGEPVTCLKDQSKGGGLVFLLPHPKYLAIKDISMMKGRVVEPLMECSGFCSVAK